MPGRRSGHTLLLSSRPGTARHERCICTLVLIDTILPLWTQARIRLDEPGHTAPLHHSEGQLQLNGGGGGGGGADV